MSVANRTFEGIDCGTLAWMEGLVGERVERVERVPGGASRLSFIISFGDPISRRRLFLRTDSGDGPMSGTIFTLDREARLVSALAGTNVKVPVVHGINDGGDAVLLECVRGNSDYGALTNPMVRSQVERDLIVQLALLHSAPVDFAAVLGGPQPATVEQALHAEISLWRDQYRSRVPNSDALIDFALDWLRRRAPGGAQPPVLVHGDIGPGNFMFDDSGITALIDWEIAHAGHPLEDIACIIARTLGVPFSDPNALIAAYGRASGQPVDRNELRYCLVLVLTRFSIGIAMAMARGGTQLDVPMLLKFRQVNLHALALLLAEAEGLAILPLDAAAIESSDESSRLFDHAIAVLGEMAGESTDSYTQHRARGLADLLSFLRNVSAYGSDKWRSEAGRQTSDTDVEFESLLAAGDDAGRSALLAGLVQQSHRRHALMREALGPMFDRQISFEVGAEQ